MSQPALKLPQREAFGLGGKECPGGSLCPECFCHRDHGGFCSGCDGAYRERCLKRQCDLDCSCCGGGRKAVAPGCCGRTLALSPERAGRIRRILARPVPEHAPEPLPIRCRLIPVIYAQLRKHRLPERFPSIDAWATPIHKLADRCGRFRSEDLKDYLGLPADRKLILSTCAPDDYQEALWSKGPKMRFREHGIDYWFPGHFSIYDNDSRLYQFLSAKRQQIHAVTIGSQFAWFRLGDGIPLEFLEPMRNASSVLFSSQQTFRRRYLAHVHEEIRIADDWFPRKTSFFVIGGNSKLPVSADRVCYRINSRWQLLALKGRDMANLPRPDLPTDELLAKNLKEVVQDVDPDKRA